METNEISMFMDVKFDIHDKRSEAVKFKSWVKCLVKIEAVKCLPCFLRITFIRNVEDEAANLSVSITIPGITISLATSRTKEHSYGIFWLQNRKRCSIYFSVDSESNCRRHMKWMKKSIKNLELYRQVLLETRSVSHCLIENCAPTTFKDSKHNMQDILGPLPKIPDWDKNLEWSRRVSGASGIYEEIPDSVGTTALDWRQSVDSAIYEEMKPTPSKNGCEIDDALVLGPPIPPRERINTFERDPSVRRSNTNPETESELVKRKKYINVLNNIFGRAKRCESLSECQVSNSDDMIRVSPEKTVLREHVYENTPVSALRQKHNMTKRISYVNKRHSISSPDLSKTEVIDELSTLEDMPSFSFDALPNCGESKHAMRNIEQNSRYRTESVQSLNISQQIQPNFNISCNSSTVNLVGSNLYGNETISGSLDDSSVYCPMAPIIKERRPHSNDSDKENEDCKPNASPNKDPVSANESLIYENMTNSSNMNASCNLYENVGISLSTPKSPLTVFDEGYYQTPRKLVISIDEKIPSYYPNSCDTAKSRRRSPLSVEKASHFHMSSNCQTSNNQNTRRENLYVSSPQRIIDHRLRSNGITSESDISVIHTKKFSPVMARKISENMYTVTRHIDSCSNLKTTQSQNFLNLAALQSIDFKFDDTKNESDLKTDCIKEENRIYHKYATLTRISPIKYIEKCSKAKANITNDLGNVKKFASLPRFKKIDFSPLKLKINNVLHRHHDADNI